MTVSANRARRNDVVALETRHTSTYIDGRPTVSYSVWQLAYVTSVTREGLVKAVRLPGTQTILKSASTPNAKVWVISNPALQKAARRLAVPVNHGRTWDGGDDIKAAILAEKERLT